ncbi:hypothetical protein ACFLUO_09765 [Chloroflexota bacterium]
MFRYNGGQHAVRVEVGREGHGHGLLCCAIAGGSRGVEAGTVIGLVPVAANAEVVIPHVGNSARLPAGDGNIVVTGLFHGHVNIDEGNGRSPTAFIDCCDSRLPGGAAVDGAIDLVGIGHDSHHIAIVRGNCHQGNAGIDPGWIVQNRPCLAAIGGLHDTPGDSVISENISIPVEAAIHE